MKLIRSQGRIFIAALPQECVTPNIARRILKLIREEYDNILQARVSIILFRTMCAGWFSIYQYS